jgi:flagellar biosynthesis protein FliP
MMRRTSIAALVTLLLLPSLALAVTAPGAAEVGAPQATSYARLLVGLSLLSVIPAALVAMTSFTRIIVTLSFLRHALGMPETPPNIVLITLAMLLTFFTMAPTLEKGYEEGVAPFLEGKIETAAALERGLAPLKTFMTAHVRDEDLQSVSELARTPEAAEQQDAPLRVLAPAFMLSELRAAFVAGFMIFLPFLLIDLLVAAILMALGMMMVPPSSISLPLKVMLFVLIDGWSLLLRALAGIYA